MISEASEPTKQSSLPPTLPTQKEIERYIAEGNRLRSEMIVGGLSRFWRCITSPFRAAPAEDPSEPVANSLAAIRSAVEILRDTPDLDAGERRRFAEIILREENRLEAMLANWRGHRSLSA